MPLFFSLIEGILIVYFSSIVLLTFVLFIGSLFYRERLSRTSGKNDLNRIAILIPAYKEDDVILHIANEMISLDYPEAAYEVFIIADSFEQSTLEKLSKLNVEVVEVSFEKSTKAKALNHCLEHIKTDDFDLAVISDADNVMEKDFLKKVNNVFNSSDYQVIQAHRTAKNINTGFAVLDAMSEEVNNNLFRKGHNGLGLSSSLIGSGIIFRTQFLIDCLSSINTVDEDKALQLNILEAGEFIPFFNSIMIYDEKVSNGKNFQNQRRRWLSSQFKYLSEYAGKGFKYLFKGRVSYFLMAVAYNFYLPRVLNLMLLTIVMMLHILIPLLHPYQLIWALLFWIYFLSILFSIPKYFFSKKFLGKALMVLPGSLFSMFKILFKLKSARKEFIKTEHSAQEIDHTIMSKRK